MTSTSEPPSPILIASERTIIRILIIGAVLPLLDTTLVSISLHSIGTTLGAPLSMMQWVVTAYTLAAASAVPLCAWLTQRFGAKQLWVFCLGLFLVGACLSAVAQDVKFLIFSRVLQGIATGLLLPTMQTIVVICVGQKKARAALSAIAVPTVLAPVFGPLIGGATLQLFDWRLLFWAHVPICVLAIGVASVGIPNTSAKTTSAFDSTGFLLLCPGLITIFYGLSALGNDDAGTWAIPLVLGLTLMSAFTWHGYKRKGNAIVDISLFNVGNLRSACTLLFFSSVAYYGGAFLFPLYLIQIGGYEPNLAGLFVGIHGIGILLARHKLPQASRRWGDRRIEQAAILLALTGSIILIVPQFVERPSLIALGMILRGAGVGVLTLLSMSAAYEGLGQGQIAHASSLTRIITHLGSAIGVTVVAGLAVSSKTLDMNASSYVHAHLALIACVMACIFACTRLQKGAT